VNALDQAAALVTEAMQAAYSRGDPWQAERLLVVVHAIENEAAYADNLDRGLAVVRPRNYPPGAMLGWFFRNDAHVCALRRARGLWMPEPVEVA
jgi:hypothetical protein